MLEIEKLESPNQNAINEKLAVIQIGYPEILAITDDFMVVLSDREFRLIPLNDAEKSRNNCSSYHLFDDSDNDNIAITAVNKGKYKTVIKLGTNIYSVNGLLISCQNMYDVSILTLLNEPISTGMTLSVILIRQRDSKIMLNIDIKEPPLIPYCSPARVQFLTPDNIVYGISQIGSLMKKEDCFWETIDGPELTYD